MREANSKIRKRFYSMMNGFIEVIFFNEESEDFLRENVHDKKKTMVYEKGKLLHEKGKKKAG